ncbi:uncharacterized protein TRAVEDRAFT_134468 [Trametes versicolor FP-101664 SS1]|uniref:uncharacterized protein n=1 Tax=Trametes versicolor (strain FP-101664) TaxID=717944 RepID=UPI0004623F77|nr:uncharacterized protein TRAVEDRAFT_134468 [Trametes versicolor FP-101664 SS1]EIW52994.1 hypothetical protein TRAVEDRAFT_134468 [Trametes versicolor FP-101664 SS1]
MNAIQSNIEQICSGDIDLQPPYQRDVVWPDTKQIGLIDSIFRNFYVPPVIFVVHTTDDGGERRVCVDGKQRLTSIHRFTGDKFVFRDDTAVKGQLLPEKYRKLFVNKQIVCMEYQDITSENEREIFQRVQLGMALTPAERLQAVSSPIANFVRELLEKYVEDQLSTTIEWDTSRANDFRGLASSVYTMSKWPHITTLPSIGVIEKWLHDSEALDEELQQDIHNTFELFCQLAKDKKLNKCFWLPNIKKVAPMEFLCISLLIHSFKRKMTMAQLSESISLLRKDIRTEEKDVRQNSRTMKQVLTFLKGLHPSQLKAQSGEPAASKRKRNSSSEGVDHPPSKKAAPSKSQTTKPSNPPPPRSAPTPPSPCPPIDPPTQPSSSIRPPPNLHMPTGPSSARAPPTGPRNAAASPMPSSISSRPIASLPPRPPIGPPARQNSIGDTLMARMASAPSPASPPMPRYGGYPSPSMQFHPGPNDPQGNRAYDANRDPRHPAYHQDGRYGAPGQPPGQGYGRRN